MQRILSELISYSYKLDILSLRFTAFAVLFSRGKKSYLSYLRNLHSFFNFFIPFALFAFTLFSYNPFMRMRPFCHNSSHRFFVTLLHVKRVQVSEGRVLSLTHPSDGVQ
jgi:hypothetical protein